MRMNTLDKILLSIFMWLGTRWFNAVTVGRDANDTVVYVVFEIEGFDKIENVDYSVYERK